ncbi:unnamed protein product [Acanthoscelides obtectus]|uniref:BED-type domain-containing protein n=1 Tax=Acanthoscelides obtectus TaxID=200917 RepID=A0A9P0LPY6_ACAOB|nr:unnamed protein product [Acanthoscelides obtectus]CAK1654635.1 hypothetical protein AOBTE_LOCUS18731 [Acanthoscelides obtectus]
MATTNAHTGSEIEMSQRERNPIWQFFEKSTNDLSKAVCKICKKSLSLGSQEPKNRHYME